MAVLHVFTHADIAAATNNFDPDRLLGRGASASVFRGCLANGTEVAVKRFRADHAWDCSNDLNVLANVTDPNVLRPLGQARSSGRSQCAG